MTSRARAIPGPEKSRPIAGLARSALGVGPSGVLGGVPVDFTISTWNGSAWVQQAAVTGNSQVYRWIPFTAPVSTTQVQITVTKDQPVYAGEFTRISELDP